MKKLKILLSAMIMLSAVYMTQAQVPSSPNTDRGRWENNDDRDRRPNYNKDYDYRRYGNNRNARCKKCKACAKKRGKHAKGNKRGKCGNDARRGNRNNVHRGARGQCGCDCGNRHARRSYYKENSRRVNGYYGYNNRRKFNSCSR